jgi:hypothetical protein
VVLVRLCVEGADLALTERVIESGVNIVRGDTHARRGRPVDDQIFSQPPKLSVGSHVSQLWLFAQFCNHLFSTLIEFGLIRVFQCVLELVAAGAIIHREVLYRLHIEVDAFHFSQFGFKPADYRCRVHAALGKRFQVDLDAPAVEGCVGPVYSDE